jgi:hypothetical protein
MHMNDQRWWLWARVCYRLWAWYFYEDAAVRGGSTLKNPDWYSSRAPMSKFCSSTCLLIPSDMLSFGHSFCDGPSTDYMQVELRAKAQHTTSR